MEHSLDYYKQCSNDVCRICGKLFATPKQKRLCVNLQSDILLICGLNVKDDMHSTYLCNKRYFAIRNIKKRQSVSSIQKARDTFHSHEAKWCSFNPAFKLDQCTSCRHRKEISLGCLRRRSLCHQPTISPKA